MAQTRYCNLTTDLYRAFPRLEDYKEQKTLRGWVVHSGSVYRLGNVGYGEILFENGLQLTKVADLVSVDAAGEYFYDEDEDVLYLQATSGVPTDSTNIYVWGLDWDTFKGWAVDQASRDVDSLLDARFPVPLPESPYEDVTDKYDIDLRRATSKIAAALIISRREPMIFEPEPNVQAALYNEGKMILDEYNEGKRRFSWEMTKDEAGRFQIVPQAANTGDGILQVRGAHGSWHDDFWRVKITTGGAVATATFQYSTDNGATYNGSDITTSRLWQEITGAIPGTTLVSTAIGFYIRFLDRDGEFDVDDEWQIEIQSDARQSVRSKMTTARIDVS